MKPSTQTQTGDGLRAFSFPKSGFGLCRLVVAGMFIGLLGPACLAWERTDVLEAIHQVENPHNTMRIGRRGELGPFQLRPSVWYTYTQKPFSLAADQDESRLVAEAHYEWIKRGLERNKLEVTPYYIGLVWNAGLHATLNNRASETSKYYAQRVANLVESQQPVRPAENTAVASPQPEPVKQIETM